MAIQVALNHRTTYQYDRSVSLSPHTFRLRPAPHCRTTIDAYSLTITPDQHFINWQQDPFGNYLARVVFPEHTTQLTVEVDILATLTSINPFDFFVDDYAENYPFDYESQLKRELIPYLERQEHGPLLQGWVKEWQKKELHIVDFLVELNQALQQAISYTIRTEPGVQSCETTLAKQSGSCRDSAWLLVQIVRHLGLAARFVSGYLVQLTPDIKSLDGPSGPDADFTDLHAWAEVYVPGAGWIGLDPTSGLFAGEGHIPLACTPDFRSAAPVCGATSKSEVTFSFTNSVTRIKEEPRVTKPYTDEQWHAIDQLGEKVDQQLTALDVRLTMGGEPTFVGIDNPDTLQWNTHADGPEKRERAEQLLDKLKVIFTKGGLKHYSQGKWYPGEPLPRWELGCYWRKDGQPLWQNPTLFANPLQQPQASLKDAERFILLMADQLRLPTNAILPAYEDTYYLLWQEENLPLDTPESLSADDQRQAILTQLKQYKDQPRGYVLPVNWDFIDQCWKTAFWQFRRGKLFLIPGDSPIGLRLPLDRIHWSTPHQEPHSLPRDLFEHVPPLPERVDNFTLTVNHASHPPAFDLQPQTLNKSGSRGLPLTTAFVIELRNDTLHVFMPPLSHLEHYIVLLQTIEQTADRLQIPIIIEGYPPPIDQRIESFKVTPDPGVIEVNIHPASSWSELKSITNSLYQAAHESRLGTEKYMLDGRQCGTGGGNHVTLGGHTPADSPLLRRPDVLQSLITYWQHHPGLSYLFSGLFVGPTSQAPRIDEARHEALYELEIAFQQIPKGETPHPWLIDRLLRHLLVDITGNTHRAEFCIDKLYPPENAQRRLGLLEFRAFEMPPHARMSLVQMLLLRTLVARFWQTPYHHPLVRWGTALHDRFMLPYFIWNDIAEVAADIQQSGYGFQLNWLAPFLYFRFPVFGEIQLGDIHLELRGAIEPWHVLGEEVIQQGTSRFVDSSVERLQIKVAGLTPDRHIISCNGMQVPLHPTGTPGEYVGGVRFRAWQPPSALHPTIGVHSPLVFDVIDSWSCRAIGGCTYHVAHPGGRNFEAFPVNSYAAEGRRLARFWSHGHSPGCQEPHASSGPSHWRFVAEGSGPGPINLPKLQMANEYPYTLDLRQQ